MSAAAARCSRCSTRSASPAPAATYLVVLTSCDGRELGNSVLASALGGEVRPVHRWDLVADAFGARKLDPRLTGRPYRWLAEALLDAQPSGGWRRTTGTVLQFDTALSRLASVRLGHGGEEERIDAAALLDWSRDETRLARFLSLRQDEQDGLAGWLRRASGPGRGDRIPAAAGRAGARRDPVRSGRGRAVGSRGGRPRGGARRPGFGRRSGSWAGRRPARRGCGRSVRLPSH